MSAIQIDAENFPVFKETRNASTEHPVDAAIRMAREAFLLDQCDRLDNQLHDLAHAVAAGDPAMFVMARAIVGERVAA